MNRLILERWSRGSSGIHRRDPRAKAGALMVFLVVVATAHHGIPILAVAMMVLLAASILCARLPLGKVLVRSGTVLIVTLTLALAAWLAGDPEKAIALVLKSYLSALAVTVVVATTPMPALLGGLEACGVPQFFLLVTQFVYRYLFVVSEETRQMKTAAAARGGTIGFRGAAAAVGALFARSHSRAEEIHRAMLARGFTAKFNVLNTPRFRAADALFLLGTSVALVLVRAGVERVSS